MENVSNGFQLVSNWTITFWPIMTYLNVSQPFGCGLIFFAPWGTLLASNNLSQCRNSHWRRPQTSRRGDGQRDWPFWRIHSLLCQQLLEMHNVCFMSLLWLFRFGPTFHWNFMKLSTCRLVIENDWKSVHSMWCISQYSTWPWGGVPLFGAALSGGHEQQGQISGQLEQ